ncbi:MAG: cob(I)yrinic acid a,c-diamide adenosyltransferase, partial [Deltaproteobacteria bacterium]
LVAGGEHRLVVLDGLTTMLRRGYVREADVLNALTTRPRRTHVIVTGEDASAPLLEAADLVTEMGARKVPAHGRAIAHLGLDF